MMLKHVFPLLLIWLSPFAIGIVVVLILDFIETQKQKVSEK